MLHYTDNLSGSEIRLVFHHFDESDPSRFHLPTYYFKICDLTGATLGWCDLRIGHNEGSCYGGNIGYQIEEPHRGHHYAGKACRLLFELAKRHGMDYLLITCSPDNIASRKTCEYAGGKLIEIAELPPDNALRADGETHSCIFRFDLTK